MKLLVVCLFCMASGLSLRAENAVPSDAISVAADQLPPLVSAAIHKKFEKYEVVTAAKEERNDYVHYYVTVKIQATKWKMEILDNGTLVSAETEK